MLYTRKRSEEYNALAEQVIKYAKKSGYADIKADFVGYDTPSSLTMVNEGTVLTPDFTAQRGDKKYYFELVVKNDKGEDQNVLISKWKALEMIAKMKGGTLTLFAPRGSYKFASELIQDHGIDAVITKLTSARA